MIHQLPTDDDLLQGRLDGTLSPEESARLDARLAASPALRERAAQLASLVEALALVKATDPAPALAARVMSLVQTRIESVSGRRASIAARQEAGMSQAGHAKKVIWGLAAAAVLVLGVWFVTGTPDVGGPAAGTVGVAKRYAAPQIADEDVKLDASAQTIQAFLDSEAFGRVMADPEAVALLGDPKVRSAIGARAANHESTPSPIDNAAIAAVIDDPSFVVLVTNPAFETSWADAARKAVEINNAIEKSRLGQNATGLHSGLGQNATGLNGALGQNATGLNSGLGQNAALKGGLGQNATGLNTGLGQNAALKGGLGQNATGIHSQLTSQLQNQLTAQLQTQLKSALQGQLQNGLKGSLHSGLGQKSSQ